MLRWKSQREAVCTVCAVKTRTRARLAGRIHGGSQRQSTVHVLPLQANPVCAMRPATVWACIGTIVIGASAVSVRLCVCAAHANTPA